MMEYKEILRQYWGFSDFRGIQKEIIESIGRGQDTLGLMPTGGGKSITFQVPALSMDGVCIVITPLIALMKDQVDHLLAKGIRAAAIYSGMTRPEIIKTLENTIFGAVKILYVSPERLSSELFQTKLRHMKVSFITVDEAHCISQWGYDFRPSYLTIAALRDLLPGIPVLALTATATPHVVDDIQERLKFARKNVFRMSFERKNLSYVVRTTGDKLGELTHILRSVDGSAIVYVRSRKKCKEINELLTAQGFSSTFYHAGLDHLSKDERQKQWQEDRIRVMVATNAFGMGIDKPNVRLVIHMNCPDSIEAYFQEAGRGGRDGQKAYAVLLYNGYDKSKLHKRIAETFPEKDFIKLVYEHLAYFFQIGVGSGRYHTFSFEMDKFCNAFGHSPRLVDSALRIIQRAGYIYYENEPEAAPRLMFLLTRNELYRLNELTPLQDQVITVVLRQYGGVFNDYVFINEERIADIAGLTKQQIYLVLKSLSQRRILHYIPQRKIPFITYLTNRIDGDRLVIGKEVYDERKRQFTNRIEAIISYATNDQVCRSRQLLSYLGQPHSPACHCCDVCLEKETDQESDDRMEAALDKIMALLSDKELHSLDDILQLDIPKRQLDAAIDHLRNEEIIHLKDDKVYIK
ncbi:ATP-dependent DNA helicase, RecQ family [Segatella baroniae F0067]|uniref:ATP-dependent DNA helicase RecQ n=2 Tax=Segatella baroniae TaxID=305719 RepID=U2QGV0_9BACT|nr:ATP-dependent DNA helicase, RecQ family [Segatella baroniae F0067]